MALSSGWLHDIFAGSVSGGVAVLVSHPFDTIRVRQQTIQTGWRARGLRGTASALTCVRELSKTEGLTGFYRGIASPLVATPVQFATTFFGFGLIKRHLEGLELSNHAVSALAGGGAGAVQCLVVTPFDVIKIRMQTCSAGLNRRGTFTATMKLVQTEGISSLYRGLFASLVRKIPANALFFGSYEATKDSLVNSIGQAGIIVAGGTAGVTSWVFTYPLDVLKTRVQASAKYSGMLDCLLCGLKSEGFGFLFRGLPITLMRSFPMHGILFYTYDAVTRILEDRYTQSSMIPAKLP